MSKKLRCVWCGSTNVKVIRTVTKRKRSMHRSLLWRAPRFVEAKNVCGACSRQT